MFMPGEVERYIPLKILNDDMPECVEIFTATLTTDDCNVDIAIGYASATVIINDRIGTFSYMLYY